MFVSGNNSCEMKNKTQEGSYADSRKKKAVRGLRGRSLHADSHKTKAMATRMKLSETARGSSMLESFECCDEDYNPQLVLDNGAEDIDSQSRVAATRSKMKQLVLQSARR